jgi:hypothetical protein
VLALTQNRWKSARKNNNHIKLPTVIISCGFAVSASSAVYSQQAEKRLFPGHEFSPEGVRPGLRVSYAAAAAAAAETRSTSFLPAFVVLPTDYFIMLVFSAEKYNRKIIITKTPPTPRRAFIAHAHTHTCTHIHTTHTGTPTHARMNKYNIICTYIVISYIFYSGLREYTLSRYALLYICGGYNNNNNENMCFSPS